MEALVLPGLAVTILIFIAYVAIFWLGDKDKRAFARFEKRDSKSKK